MNASTKVGDDQHHLRPLYNLAELNERPDVSVVVVGDEKCVEAAGKYFPRLWSSHPREALMRRCKRTGRLSPIVAVF
jgi:hypothetical protein